MPRMTKHDKSSVLCSTLLRLIVLISMCPPHHHSGWLDWPLVKMTTGNLCLTGGSRKKSHRSGEQGTALIIIHFLYSRVDGRFAIFNTENWGCEANETCAQSVWLFLHVFSIQCLDCSTNEVSICFIIIYIANWNVCCWTKWRKHFCNP